MKDELKNNELAAKFNQLDPVAVMNSVAEIGVNPTGRFIIMNSYENRVYQMELEDGTWVVGKYYRPGRWSEETILEEHHFLKELQEEEIPVAAPLELRNGSTLSSIEGIKFAFFPRIGGRSPQELGEEQIKRVGRLIARIHNVGAQKEASCRLKLTPETYGKNNLAFLVQNNVLPKEVHDAYVYTVETLLERITPLFQEVPFHRIHGDCHLANLIETKEGFTFLDFDDMVMGPAVQDIWMLIPSSDKFGDADRELLLSAYTEFRDFNPAWLLLVEPLRALRYVHYSTWIARRIEDPYFIRTFNYFGTVEYWQRETIDLREQLGRIDSKLYLQ